MPAALPRILAALAAGTGAAAGMCAREPAGYASMLFDSYLARAALSDPAYRADLEAGAADPLPPGRIRGESPLIGPFTYRPRTFGELTRAERAGLLADPGFRAFLLATRAQADRAEPPAATAVKSGDGWAFSVAPEEMLGSEPLRVILPP